MEFFGSKTKEEINNFFKTRIESISFSKRLENVLTGLSIRTIGGILRKDGNSFYVISDIGLKGVEEIQQKLSGAFYVKFEGKDFKFLPRYHEIDSSSLNINLQNETAEDRVESEKKKKEVEVIEEKYFEKQEELFFIYQIKVISLGLDSKIENLLLRNQILTVGDLLNEISYKFQEKYSLDSKDVNYVLNAFNYFIIKNKHIEKELEELRNKEFELIGYINPRIEKKTIFSSEESKNINARYLQIFLSFREGITLDKIGKEYGVTRERVRQIVKIVIDKIGLDYEEERIKIYSIRNELKPKKIKIIKEKKWGAYKYDICTICKTIDFPHFKSGVCQRCAGAFRGYTRENIIKQHNNKCDQCGISREESKKVYIRDLYISKKIQVLCKKCYLTANGKMLGEIKKNKWKMFYNQ